MKITILVDNNTTKEGLIPEWGFSALIQDGENTILFDTGETDVFLQNAKTLGIDLSGVTHVVLSHAHVDHTSGLLSFVHAGYTNYQLLINRYFFTRKYWDQDTGYQYVGNAFDQEYIARHQISTVMVSHPVHPIGSKNTTWLMGECQRLLPFEKMDPVQLMWNGADYVVDTFREEQNLVIDTPMGLIIISGCAHVGICNIIQNAKQQFGKPVYAFVGGTHFVACEQNPYRMEESVAYLNSCGIQHIYACHCTSEFGNQVLSQNCPAFSPVGVGTVLEF